MLLALTHTKTGVVHCCMATRSSTRCTWKSERRTSIRCRLGWECAPKKAYSATSTCSQFRRCRRRINKQARLCPTLSWNCRDGCAIRVRQCLCIQCAGKANAREPWSEWFLTDFGCCVRKTKLHMQIWRSQANWLSPKL